MTHRLYCQNNNHNLIGFENESLELGSNYLALNGEVPDEKLRELFKSLTYVQGSTLFWIGDFLNTVEARRGEAYAKAYEMTDYSSGTLRNAKSVCKRIPRELRVNLSYKHHEAALGLTKNAAVAVDFLRKAEKLGQTVKVMSQSIRLALADSKPDPEKDRLEYNDEEMLLVLKSFGIIHRFLENTTSATFGLKKRYVLAELESLTKLAQEVCN